MAKDYSQLSKEELLKIVEKIDSRKKYGLIWDEEKTKEIFEIQSQNALPILKSVISKDISSKSPKPNILIEGDNYHALSVLNFTHQEKIDLIYIDPPYNTGNKDFIYNDKYIDADDAYRHSKWLSFMDKRLRLAKKLLKDDGLIFISIDDNEIAQLKLLADEIFGEENFRNFIVVSRVKKNIQERQYTKSLNLGHGDILVYGMPKSLVRIPVKFQQKEERWHAFDAPGIRQTMEYEIFGHKPPKGRHWMFQEEKAKELIAKGLLRSNPKTGKPQYKLEASNETRLDSNWTDLQEGASNWGFENGEKNVDLIKRIIKMHPDDNCTVLDFFAGSGTTAQAVLELNKEGPGRRTFILCTNDENDICKKYCYPRIKKVINGYETKRGKGKEGSGGSLKYFKTAFVKISPAKDDMKIRLANECTEMLCLREGVFDELKSTSDYKILKQNDKILAVYYSLERDGLKYLKKDLDKLEGQKTLYCFTLDPLGLSKSDFVGWSDVILEPIPQKILEVYKQIYEY